MATNINRNLPGYAYDAATNSGSTPSAINPFATIADIPLSTGTQLLSGGASWSNTGMIFNVSALTYKINGVLFSSSPTSVTLATGDPTYDRFDAIIADINGVVSVITGVPAVNPLVPSIPGDSVLVQYVLVSVGATTPNITNAFVYRQGSVPDWLPGVTGVGTGAPTADFSSTTPAPFEGAECLNATFSIMDWTGRFVRFTAPSPISRSAYAVLSMRVNLPVNYTNLDANVNGRRPVVALMNGNTFLGTIFLDQFGLNRSLTNTWQLVTIPLSVFTSAPNLTTITQLRLYSYEYINTVPPSVAIAFDDIKFQSGFGPQSNVATVDILENGLVTGATSKLNFVTGNGSTWSIVNDPLNNRINIQNNPTNAYVEPELNVVGRTLLDIDAGKFLMIDSVNPEGIVVPRNNVIPIPIGAVIKISQQGTGVVSISGMVGVSLYSASGLIFPAQYAVATLTKTNTDEWYIEYSN